MFEEAITKFDKMADYLDKAHDVIKSIPDNEKKMDEIAKKLEIQMDRQIEPPTPLSATPAEALREAQTKFKTKAIILAREISQRCLGKK